MTELQFGELCIKKIRALRTTAWFNENTMGSYAIRRDALETAITVIRTEMETIRLGGEARPSEDENHEGRGDSESNQGKVP